MIGSRPFGLTRRIAAFQTPTRLASGASTTYALGWTVGSVQRAGAPFAEGGFESSLKSHLRARTTPGAFRGKKEQGPTATLAFVASLAMWFV
jgi:hypothetical protein